MTSSLQPLIPARPFLERCCIGSVVEARLAMAAGAHALGRVSAMPSGPGVIAENRIAVIAVEVVARPRRCHTTALQLVEQVRCDELAGLRDALTEVQLVKVMHVTD